MKTPWQPIETVPNLCARDTPLLFAVFPRGKGYYGVAHSVHDLNEDDFTNTIGDYYTPTHWMSIPNPPPDTILEDDDDIDFSVEFKRDNDNKFQVFIFFKDQTKLLVGYSSQQAALADALEYLSAALKWRNSI